MDALAGGAAALRTQLKVVRGGGSVLARSADPRASVGLGVSWLEAGIEGVAIPKCGITPGGQTAAHSDAQVTAQQSMSSCWPCICDDADMGQLAAGTADAGPAATDRESAIHSMASRRRMCRP